jgi:hypothetical protein
VQLPISTIDFSPEEQTLWQRVKDLWALSLTQDAERIRAALHPLYVGWDMTSPLPHDRESAVESASRDSPRVSQYDLQPLSVRMYDDRVGVVHYRYAATVVLKDATSLEITGGWTEVYLKDSGEWIMIAVSGRPDSQSGGSRALPQAPLPAQQEP